VAEDNPTNRKIIAQILEYGGFDVTIAHWHPGRPGLSQWQV
jgi:CheY-like chemotaxis protein